MIDEKKLIDKILYVDGQLSEWNNQHCPMWVINMIKVQPVFEAIGRVEEKNLPYDGVEDYVRHVLSEIDTPAESCTHVEGKEEWEK